MRFDVVDRVLHCGDAFCIFVGDLSLEFFFESHDELDGVQRIRAEVLDERSGVLDILFLDTKLFGDDFLYAFFDAAHCSPVLLWGVNTLRLPVLASLPKGRRTDCNPIRKPC